MNFHRQVYQLVKKIPRGKVASYGQIAAMLGTPRAARMVGWALHQMDSRHDIPWQRIINSRGIISTTCQDHTKEMQAYLLKKEGVEVKLKNEVYQIDLKKYLWQPK